MIQNMLKHIKLVIKHKYQVFKLCCKIGMPFRGFMHDWSKFSPTEFWESVKYYNGKKSPIIIVKKENGYSKAWLHHKGRNKHHHEYWYDYAAPEKSALMPYKYTAEMICDTLAAGQTYQGKNWTNDYQLKYYLKDRQKKHINPKIDAILLEVYEMISEKGIDEVINPKTLKKIYISHVGDLNDKKY